MKKIDLFTNLYPISKTLRFSLKPIGKTEENFINAKLLEADKERASNYAKVKKCIDKYHKHFIETVLNGIYIDNVKDYAALYYKSNKTDKEMQTMDKLEESMRKFISKAFTKNEKYKEIFGKEIIQKILPQFLSDEAEKNAVEMFYNFTTYFKGFHDNRENMYTDLKQSTAISYRCINENLPKFLDNVASFKKVAENLPSDTIDSINKTCLDLYGIYVTDIFTIDYFSFVLSQSGIDKYNNIIGGYTTPNGTKIQGLNEYINLYNQQIAKKDKAKRLPALKALYKQILSDKESISFIPESFESDSEVILAINEFYQTKIVEALEKSKALFDKLNEFNKEGIYIKSGASITDISNLVFGDWSAISQSWNDKYESDHPLKKGKNPEKYYEEEKQAYNKIQSFSIAELQTLGSAYKTDDSSGDIVEYYKQSVLEKISDIEKSYEESSELFNSDYKATFDKKLCQNEKVIRILKDFLDIIKDFEHLVKPLLGTGKEDNKDELFYGEFLPVFDLISSIDRLYDKVRNYVTKKPYSTDKIKLNFENPQHLDGWDKNKERDYRCVLLRRNGLYYLAIMDKQNNKSFVDPQLSTDGCGYEKIEYKLLPGPNKMLPKVFFAKSNIDMFKPDKKVLEIRDKETFKKGNNFNLDDCHYFIDFFKESISKHEDWSRFGFEFSDTNTYKDISEFYDEVRKQAYSIKFNMISEKYIDNLVECGQLYLFQIYNKDFSKHSHGKPNLHTMYFKMLFDEKNLENVVYQLNGGAEMFYRESSIKDSEKIVHYANQPIKNKNTLNPKSESVFEYDIIKDKRYTKHQFSLHLPITLNFKADGQSYLNNDVRLSLKKCENNYVIGIDRGERNLLYICVVDCNGNIVYQKSLNEIISDNGYKVDYHKLLDAKETDRTQERKNWSAVENIKELKEGYLSQVVHEICKLIVKYDAIVAMEDLNFGFKKGRFKVEKQVYQKFENMLLTKLNYLVEKDSSPENNGGLLNAYQLTNKVDGINKAKQNGFVFYVPAWLTSKIDPVTGFVDLLKPKYKSVADSLEFISQIDDIRYNMKEDMFEFDIDYSKFSGASISFRKKWTVHTNGERIINIRDKESNNKWINKTIVLTDEFKSLFSQFGIDTYNDLKAKILKQTSKDFHYGLMKLFAYTLQMRNSEIGNVDVDYLISPVKDNNGNFYDSRICAENETTLPENADANGAYNIARKALWAVSVLKNTEDNDLRNCNLSIKNADWLEFVQK